MVAEVLNGSVEVGDQVAYAVRAGNHGGLRCGIVREILEHEGKGWDRETRSMVPVVFYELKIEVTHTSGCSPKIGKVVTVGTGLVAKIG